MQKDFMDLEGSALPVEGSSKIIEPINEFISRLRPNEYEGVLFTQDWHTADHIEYQPDGEPFPKHCVEDTEGAKLSVVTAIVPRPIPLYYLHKNMFDMWGEDSVKIMPSDIVTKQNFEATQRDKFFKDLKDRVDEIEVIGVTSDVCCNFAIGGAVKAGFKVTVYGDLVKGLFREIDQVLVEDHKGSDITVV